MIGSTVCHYKILQILGSGGMGVVYKAKDLRLGRLVAIKFLPPSLTAVEEEKERFILEAQAASILDHPNICTVYEISETEYGQMYMALAFYEGETLKTRIEKGPVESQEAIRIAIQIAQALAKAHERKIVHRDIKPANIIITPEKVVKILDFGLAKLAASSRITKSHSTLGTVAYMSPEQARGDDVDQRTDLWSLGVVLYEMITGHLPFRGDSDTAMIYRITNEEPVPARSWRPDLDPRLAAILGHGLEKDPAERYQNADELIHDLQIGLQPQAEPNPGSRLLASLKPAAKKHPDARSHWPRLTSAAAFFGLLFLAFMLFRQAGPPRPPAAASSSKVIAIFPFTVSGVAESASVQEGIMDLLFASLNGTSDWRCIDSRMLLDRIGTGRNNAVGLDEAKRIARSLGAGYCLMGSLITSGTHLCCSASLYESDNDNGNPEPITGESKEGNLAALADGLTMQVLTCHARTPAERMSRLGGMTTQSLPALKAYLEAIQRERRGDIGGAYRLFTLAAQIDSTFSLAWFRRCGLDQRWLLNPVQARIDIDKAILYGEKLPIQERRLLWAYQRLVLGENEQAVDLTRLVLAENPDNLSALDLLATRWPLVANLYGRSMLENQEAGRRLLVLDPDAFITWEGLSYAALKRGNRAEIDSFLTRFRQLEYPTSQVWGMEMGRLFLTQDWPQQQALFQRVSLQTLRDRVVGVENGVIFARDIAESVPAARLLVSESEPMQVRAHGYMLLAAIEIGRGRWGRAEAAIDTLAGLLPEYEQVFRGIYRPLYYYLAADAVRNIDSSPVQRWRPHANAARSGGVFDPLLQWQPHTLLPRLGWDFDFAPMGELLPHFRWYHLGLLSHFKGDFSQVSRYRQHLAAESGPPDAASLLRIWGNTLQALAEMEKGREAIALQLLERETPVIRWPVLYSPAYSLAFARFLRAELLHRLGRDEEAVNWYRSLTEFFIHDIPYRAPALLRMAEIYESWGRPEEARQNYEHFLLLWRECDPEFRPMAAAAGVRLNELEQRHLTRR